MPKVARENCRKISLKRKIYSKGKSGNKFKRFKREPKCVRDNIENQVAREKSKDVYEFSDSDEDRADELGMGLEISDLPFLNENEADPQKLIALTQDSVRPFFMNESEYSEDRLQEALLELKYSSFREHQEEAIKRILFGRSTLFIAPTGSGKSLCYQLPALLYSRYKKYITIVVSPLISLMEDQMANFPAALRAVSLHSNHSRQQRSHAISQLINGDAQVVFVSPEAIVGGVLDLDDLKSLPPIGFVCIDEAHCLSEWSHNFRPAYLQFFSILREHLNIKTYLALTATASRATSYAIAKCLTINPDTDVIGATVVPENLMLSVSCETNKEVALIKLLKTPTFKNLPSLIVYCNRRDETENVASLIRTSMQNYSSLIQKPEQVLNSKKGELLNETQDNNQSPKGSPIKLTWNAEAYHAGLPSEVRKRIQRKFIKGDIRVVVATIAFGMGINKSNVRAILHYDMPGSFESYVQEIGRAGRDGKTAQCHLFLRSNMNDVFYQQRHIYTSVVEHANLRRLVDYTFPQVVCRCVANDTEKLDKMNQKDVHLISSFQKTDFTNKQVECDDDDLDETDDSSSNSKQPKKYVRESVVRKHRACQGIHEVAFGVDAATETINLPVESIITYICQIQKAYPQLKIQQLAPIKASCRVFCYKGPKQMQDIKLRCKEISCGIALTRKQNKNLPPDEELADVTFNMAAVAYVLKKSIKEVMNAVRKVEWELVEATGRFRRSHIKVKFDTNSFNLRTVGDLNDQEKEELHKFLIDSMRKHETVERNKVLRLYKTLKAHNIETDKMGDKFSRLSTSVGLKNAIDTYFNPSDEQYYAEKANMHQELSTNEDSDKLSFEIPKSVAEAISKKAHEFILQHGTQHVPRAIARVFQGISCPNYPAEHWGKNRLWWRCFPDVDFLKLEDLIKTVWIKLI